MKKLIPLLILIIFSCTKNNNEIDRIDYDKAYKFQNNSQKDSAFKYFNKAKDNFIKHEKFSFAGSCLVNMAIIQNDYGDYYGSQETGLLALKYLNEIGDSAELSSNYNSLGIAFQNLKEYNKASNFYSLAAKFSKNPLDSLTHINNRAVAFGYSKKFDSAINLFNKILVYPNLKENLILYSRVNDNRAYFRFLQNKNYNAQQELFKVLKIRDSINDNLGLIATYSHLSEYFENSDSEKALFYANNMLHFASINKSPDDKLNALKKIIFLEDSRNTKNYFKEYQNLNDSLQIVRNRSKSQFAFERYDSEKFKRENVEKDNSILKLYIGVAALIALIIFIVFLYRKRQLKLKQEKELEVKNTELRYSKKVHDKVANKVYHVMSEVENTENMNKEVLLYKLDGIYQISRDISYEKKDVALEHNFSQHLSQMLKSYSSENIKVPIIGNEESLWEDVGDHSKVEVFYILQELMTNMKKHSKADKVLIDFSRENDLINIVYSDNGIGISEFSPKNGVQNTESRINSIGGTINFDTKTENGLKITLSFPAKN